MNRKTLTTGTGFITAMLAIAPLIAGCGNFWKASTTATTTTLAASTATPVEGASVTLTATISPTAATGTVTFYDGTTTLGTGTLSSGSATLTTSFSTTGHAHHHRDIRGLDDLCDKYVECCHPHLLCVEPYFYDDNTRGFIFHTHNRPRRHVDGDGFIFGRHGNRDLLRGVPLTGKLNAELRHSNADHIILDCRNVLPHSGL